MKELLFSTAIRASKERVWQTLWQDQTFRDWANIIDSGTYMAGELIEGHEVQFISAENGYGVTSFVETLRPNSYLLLKHLSDTQDTGEREREKQWTGGQESYTLEEESGITTLTVTFTVPAELEAYFTENYPKALARVKFLAETQ